MTASTVVANAYGFPSIGSTSRSTHHRRQHRGRRNVITGNAAQASTLSAARQRPATRRRRATTSAPTRPARRRPTGRHRRRISATDVSHVVGGLTARGHRAGQRHLRQHRQSGVQTIRPTATIVRATSSARPQRHDGRSGNGAYGIDHQRGARSLVGGTAAGARNVISGNRLRRERRIPQRHDRDDRAGQLHRHRRHRHARSRQRQAGVCARSNGADDNTIGGTTAAARNVISGNDGAGVGDHASTATAGNTRRRQLHRHQRRRHRRPRQPSASGVLRSPTPAVRQRHRRGESGPRGTSSRGTSMAGNNIGHRHR